MKRILSGIVVMLLVVSDGTAFAAPKVIKLAHLNAQQPVEVGRFLAPPDEKPFHLRRCPVLRRGLEMHGRAINSPRDHLHRLFTAQLTHAHTLYCPICGGKQPLMPLQQALQRQRLMSIVDGIEHHGRKAFGAIRYGVGLLFGYAKPAGQR